MSGTEREVDVIVVGAGPTGENIAGRVAEHGLSAVIVENELVGGECSYWACMPSKALLRPLQAIADAQRVDGARQAVTGPVDVSAVFERRDKFAGHWDDKGQVEWLESVHVELVRGKGRLAGPRRVEVQTPDGLVAMRARQAVALATGSAPSVPPVPGLAEATPWAPREATSAKSVPPRLMIIGGGVVGCEMAQIFAGLGSRACLVETAPRLLATLEPFAGDLIAEAMRSLGVDLRLGASISNVSRVGERGGEVVAELADGDVIHADEVLVAAGRRPRTEDLGVETVGLEPGRWLDVDGSLTVKGVDGSWLYAAGDVNHRALLTHQGKYQARVCADVIVARAEGRPLSGGRWGKHNATADEGAVPSVVFTDPEVASVGLTYAQARAGGIDAKAVDYRIGDVAGASLYADGYGGQARIVVDQGRETIVGATFVGAGVAELLHSATVAIVGEVPLERLWHAVPSYPTISEVWLRLLEAQGL